MFGWLFSIEVEVEPDERHVHLRHLLMKQIKNSKLKLKKPKKKIKYMGFAATYASVVKKQIRP